MQNKPLHATIILPLALGKEYSFDVPENFKDEIKVGQRVEVQFGSKRIYAGIVFNLFHPEKTVDQKLKPIRAILDEKPILLEVHLKLWKWIADYYMCTLGEVMITAMPSAFKLSSETSVVLNPGFDEDYSLLSDDEYLITEALQIQGKISIKDVQAILNKKTVYFLLKSLIDKGVVLVEEELQHRYKPKVAKFIRLAPIYNTDEEALKLLFDELEKRPKQIQALMAFMQLKAKRKAVEKSELNKLLESKSALNTLIKNEVFEQYEKIVDRLNDRYDLPIESYELSKTQLETKNRILDHWNEKRVSLIHGVTSSGKTQIYIELIQKIIAEPDQQALFLLPEIALTGQMINRLRKVFGADVGIYHSKFNPQERIEIWHKTLNGKYKLIIGARSSLFLPFHNLKLIIVDEEHDNSYKQHDPAPRYNARDAAIWYAHQWNAKVILGSATPSLESYYNSQKSKYQLLHIGERFGGVQAPEISLINLKKEAKNQRMKSHFSQTLLDAIKQTLDNEEQIILFKNRRGYSPYLMCGNCSHIPMCTRCDVSLTYHKYIKILKCHYCGYQIPQKACTDCGENIWNLQGFGTEKIEDDLQLFFPEARMLRMDLETTRSKTGYLKIIRQFEDHEVDILIGTQMVTKGLDFGKVGLVGVLSADQLMFYPDFRAMERAFQLMLQVAGRAGRRQKRGKVLIQTSQPQNVLFQELINQSYLGFYHTELAERKAYSYPPFSRMLKITLKHKDQQKVNKAGFFLVKQLRKELQGNVLGPTTPAVSKIRDYHIRDVVVKFPRTKMLEKGKKYLLGSLTDLKLNGDFKGIVIQTNVDP